LRKTIYNTNSWEVLEDEKAIRFTITEEDLERWAAENE